MAARKSPCRRSLGRARDACSPSQNQALRPNHAKRVRRLRGALSRRDFEAYLLERERFAKLQDAQALPVAIEVDSERYLQARLALLQEKVHQVDRLAGQGELPDAEITDELLKVSPLKKAVPEQTEQLEEEAFALMPHLKITELLLGKLIAVPDRAATVKSRYDGNSACLARKNT
jgi:hypothetical protein